MKVLLTNISYLPTIGGIENSLRYIARELSKLGHEVKIACFRKETENCFPKFFDGVHVIRIPIGSYRWPNKRLFTQVEIFSKGLVNLFEIWMPDTIWSRHPATCLAAKNAGFKGPICNVFATNAWMDSYGALIQTRGLCFFKRLKLLALFPFHYFALKKIEAEILKFCHPICFSKNMIRQLKNSYKGIKRPVELICPGVDRDIFNSENGQALVERVKQGFNFCPQKAYFLFVGRLATAKNLPILIDALDFLPPQISIILVGDGPDKSALTRYCDSKNVSDRVIFAGKQIDLLPGFYLLAKATILPTTVESFGQVFIESLSCGTPILGFGGKKVITAADEIIEHGKTGFVIHDVSPKALAQNMLKIFELDNFKYDKISINCINDAGKRFSWHYFVKKMINISGAGSES